MEQTDRHNRETALCKNGAFGIPVATSARQMDSVWDSRLSNLLSPTQVGVRFLEMPTVWFQSTNPHEAEIVRIFSTILHPPSKATSNYTWANRWWCIDGKCSSLITTVICGWLLKANKHTGNVHSLHFVWMTPRFAMELSGRRVGVLGTRSLNR
jgi:hypothetical protein